MVGKKDKKYILKEASRHGRTVYYFRIGDGPRIRLPDEYGSDEFWKAYEAALAGDFSLPQIRNPSPAVVHRKQRVEAVLSVSIARARQRSAARGTAFDLTLDWALASVEESDFRCPLTDIPFCSENLSGSAIHPFNPSIDRIRPGGGYTMSNCRIVIFAVNVMLSDWGSEVFEIVARGYRRKQRADRELSATTMARIGRRAERLPAQ